jgi:hypothetical protein
MEIKLWFLLIIVSYLILTIFSISWFVKIIKLKKRFGYDMTRNYVSPTYVDIWTWLTIILLIIVILFTIPWDITVIKI